jgi:integrase
MFSFAETAGLLRLNPHGNPTKSFKVPASRKVARFLSDKEAGAVEDTLLAMEGEGELNKAHGAIIRLLLLTGARKTEIVGLRWSEVDLHRRLLTLPPVRTKAGGKTGERNIVLPKAASRILSGIDRKPGQMRVFPASRGEGSTTNIQDTWEVVRTRSGIQVDGLASVRIHDLRHTFASLAVAVGSTLYVVKEALGHADSRTTERYAHLTNDPLRSMSEKVAARLGKAKS